MRYRDISTKISNLSGSGRFKKVPFCLNRQIIRLVLPVSLAVSSLTRTYVTKKIQFKDGRSQFATEFINPRFYLLTITITNHDVKRINDSSYFQAMILTANKSLWSIKTISSLTRLTPKPFQSYKKVWKIFCGILSSNLPFLLPSNMNNSENFSFQFCGVTSF